MELDKYEIQNSVNSMYFEFLSSGINGNTITQDFIVYGELESGFERLRKNVNYLGFTIINK
jgi:hypothetical protein